MFSKHNMATFLLFLAVYYTSDRRPTRPKALIFEQKLILQGNLNVDGDDKNIVLIAGQLKDGRKVIHVYHKAAIMLSRRLFQFHFILSET